MIEQDNIEEFCVPKKISKSNYGKLIFGFILSGICYWIFNDYLKNNPITEYLTIAEIIDEIKSERTI
jgi:hypothetical protein